MLVFQRKNLITLKINSRIYITAPTIIILVPREFCPIVVEIQPNNINNPGTPYTINFIIIPKTISIHQCNVINQNLKYLWVSLPSKETFVFDTPGEDTHLPFFSCSVFYVCESLNGDREITTRYSHRNLGSYTSPKIYETFFDGSGF